MSFTKKGPGRTHTITAFAHFEKGVRVFHKGYPGAKYAKKARKGTVGLKQGW